MKRRNTALLVCLCALAGVYAVTVNVAEGESVSAGSANIASKGAMRRMGSGAAGRDLLLNDMMVDGRLAAGRDVACRNCTIAGGVAAGHDVQLEQCDPVHSVSSGHDAELIASRVLSHVSSGHNIFLADATLENGLQAGHQVTAQRSVIKGVLALGGHALRLDQSTADEIRFAGSESHSSSGNNNISVVNSGIVMGNSVIVGNRISSRGWGGGGSSRVSVGSSSLSSVNGYTIKGAPGQTTVITPDQDIYVNGRRVSGSGAKTYAEYAANHPAAPQVQGPGWTDSGSNAVSGSSTSSSQSKSGGDVINVLELVNNSTVNGPVVFESGYGEVRVGHGSQFSGKVVNGRVVHI